MTAKRRTGRRSAHVAGVDGDMFVLTSGLATEQLLDGDEDYAHADRMAARSGWFAARRISWSHPSREPWLPPRGAQVYDGMSAEVDAHRPRPPLGFGPTGAEIGVPWNAAAFHQAVNADLSTVRRWRRADPSAAGPLVVELDEYEAALTAIGADLRGVHDVGQAERRFAARFGLAVST